MNSTAAKGFLHTRKIVITWPDADLAKARVLADELARTEGCDVEVDVPGKLAIYIAKAGGR